MPDRVTELLKLVENHAIRPRPADFPALVVNLLDVRFAARRRDHLSPDRFQPLEPLARHLLGQDRNRRAAQQCTVIGAAAAIIARAGPDGLLRGGVELAGDQPRYETAEAGTDLVRSRREPLADQADDACIDAGKCRRELDPVAALNPPPRATGSFFQVMRKRLSGSTSQRPMFLSFSRNPAGMVVGSFCWANVGMMMPRSRQRRTVFSSTSWSIWSMIFTDSLQLRPCLAVARPRTLRGTDYLASFVPPSASCQRRKSDAKTYPMTFHPSREGLREGRNHRTLPSPPPLVAVRRRGPRPAAAKVAAGLRPGVAARAPARPLTGWKPVPHSESANVAADLRVGRSGRAPSRPEPGGAVRGVLM